MRLLASHFLGPRLFATFSNGFAFDFVPGTQLDFGLATEKNIYAIVASKVGEMHRKLRLELISGKVVTVEQAKFWLAPMKFFVALACH